MKRTLLIISILAATVAVFPQTVENIRVVPDGENLKINYRIGASTDAQLYNVYLSCSMDGGQRFEPKAVIGDVGENIIGGKSYYTIIWDVFADVDEVINPEFFFRVELVSDMAATQTQEPAEEQTRAQNNVEEQPQEQEAEVKEEQDDSGESSPEPAPTAEEEEKEDRFRRNGFFSYNGSPYIPIGVSFGSLNNWGYYVTFRAGIHLNSATYYDEWGYEYEESRNDLDFMTMAGVTKYIVAAGFYRLHAYGGIGGHANIIDSNSATGHIMIDTGVINVLGMFNITVGLSYSIGEYYPDVQPHTNLVFGAGFVF